VSDVASQCALILSEGLDLCVRARKLDAQVDRAMEAGMGRSFPGATRCGTLALWVRDQYERDLSAWEDRARTFLTKHFDTLGSVK
jgi:hypothetical protein